MKTIEVLTTKYICFRNTPLPSKYWCENACGYTSDLLESGIYSKESVEDFGLHVFTYNEVIKGVHFNYTHYAMTLNDVIKLAKKRCFK